jgi:ATP adenylyltransferase
MDVSVTNGGNRFGWLYASAEERDPGPYNTIIAECPDAIALPSKGSIVPGWLLTLPRRPVLNLAQLTVKERARLLAFTDRFAVRLSEFGPHLAQFEHGATRPHSMMGCGVDLAHLHTVPLPFDLASEVVKRTEDDVEWRTAKAGVDPWTEVDGGEYIVVRDYMTKRAVIGVPRSAQSQLIRRVIAEALGVSDKWDYSAFPFLHNIGTTLGVFGHR